MPFSAKFPGANGLMKTQCVFDGDVKKIIISMMVGSGRIKENQLQLNLH